MSQLTAALTITLLFAAIVAHRYIMDLRRDLLQAKNEARNAWRAYTATDRELRDLQGKPTPAGYYGEEPRGKSDTGSAGFVPPGIGPTAINDREFRRQKKQAEDNTPPFADRTVLTGIRPNPSDDAIRSAASQAAAESNGREN